MSARCCAVSVPVLKWLLGIGLAGGATGAWSVGIGVGRDVGLAGLVQVRQVAQVVREDSSAGQGVSMPGLSNRESGAFRLAPQMGHDARVLDPVPMGRGQGRGDHPVLGGGRTHPY